MSGETPNPGKQSASNKALAAHLLMRSPGPMINDSYEPENLKMDEIRFYRANEKPYGAFSNLYRRPVEFEGELFPTAEHAYQAGKARKPEVRRWLMAAPTPALLAMAAHGLYVWDIAPNWSKIKFERMKGVLRAKFSQHEDLRELLLSTGSARLVESATVNNAVNRLWGEVNGVGQNKLGQLLMEVRDELRAELDSTDAQTVKRGPQRVVSKSKKSRPSASKCHATVEATEA